jgi:NADPH2:quinone reductase
MTNLVSTDVARVNADGKVVLCRRVISELRSNEVLVRACFSSMSPGTELALMAGNILPLPQDIGYSLAGVVEAVGSQVIGIKVGDAVVSTASHASLQAINASNVTKVPADVELHAASFFNLGHTALYALRQAELAVGQPLLIIGQGLLGQLITILAKASGIGPIAVVDVNEDRLTMAVESGADYRFNSAQKSLSEEDFALCLDGRHGFPCVIEATGQLGPLQDAMHWVGERGRVVMMSTTASGEESLDLSPLMMKGASLVGGYVNSKPFRLVRTDLKIEQWPPSVSGIHEAYQVKDEWSSEEDIRVFLNLLRYRRIHLEHLISHRFSWQDIGAAYAMVRDQDPMLMGGLISW